MKSNKLGLQTTSKEMESYTVVVWPLLITPSKTAMPF